MRNGHESYAAQLLCEGSAAGSSLRSGSDSGMGRAPMLLLQADVVLRAEPRTHNDHRRHSHDVKGEC